MKLSNNKLKEIELQYEKEKKDDFDEFKNDLDDMYFDLFSDEHYDIFINLMELLCIHRMDDPYQYIDFVAFLDKYSYHHHNYREEEINKYLDEEEKEKEKEKEKETNCQDEKFNNDMNIELNHIEKKRYGGELL